MSGCGSAAGQRRRAHYYGGGAITGDVKQDAGQLGVPSPQRPGAGQTPERTTRHRPGGAGQPAQARKHTFEAGEGNPKKSSSVLCQGVDVKYAWIEQHRRIYPTTLMCELLSVSRSGLNAARARQPSKRSRDDKQLLEQIRCAQRKHRGRYGRRRMTPETSEVMDRKINHKRLSLIHISEPT